MTMGELFDTMLSPRVMNAAWKRLRNDKAVWRPGLARADMEPDFVRHLLELIDDVRSGQYRPETLRRFPVEKGDGKLRILSALCLRDKILQKAAQIVLEPVAEQLFHPDSFAYRPARNVDLAHARACERVRCGLDWLVDADIRSFFDNIPHKPLIKQVRKHIKDSALTELIEGWLAIGSSQISIFSTKRGIPQGGIISPFLCNLYLHSLDSALDAANLPFVRYADDFLVFAPDKPTAKLAHDRLAEELRRLDLELHPDKTRVTQTGPHVVFLGKKLPRAAAAKGPASSEAQNKAKS